MNFVVDIFGVAMRVTRYSFCTLPRRGRIHVARPRAKTITDYAYGNAGCWLLFLHFLLRVSASEDRRTALRNSKEAIAFFCLLGTDEL